MAKWFPIFEKVISKYLEINYVLTLGLKLRNSDFQVFETVFGQTGFPILEKSVSQFLKKWFPIIWNNNFWKFGNQLGLKPRS